MKRLMKLLILVSIAGFILNTVWNKLVKSEEFISPIVKNAPTTAPIKQTNSSSLEKVVDNAMSGAQGTYGIAVKNLKTDETYYLNAHISFQAGSLYKLWTMAEVFNQLQNEKLKEDEVLTGYIQDLNSYFGIDSESAELTDGTITLNVTNALNQMITISHNYAAFLLVKRIDLANIKTFLLENDLKESILENPPKTTANDIALFFEKLYKGQLANAENTRKMIELLKRQTLNGKLPKYLPQNVAVAHKTGEIAYFSHDGGIVFSDKGDYIIVVLSESDSPKGADERIAQISKAVYDYFTSKQTNGKN